MVTLNPYDETAENRNFFFVYVVNIFENLTFDFQRYLKRTPNSVGDVDFYSLWSLLPFYVKRQKFELIIFSSMQLNDTRIQEYRRNDGVHSIFHCQDKFYISFYKIYALTRFLSDILRSWYQHWLWIKLKYLCFLNPECDGFTLSGKLNCILHRTAATFHFTGRRISQVGIRNRTSTFSKYCQEELRLKRCKNEPKCKDILNCFRQGYQKVLRIQPSYWP